MTLRLRAALARLTRWMPLVLLVALAACGTAEQYPQSTLFPKGDFARMVDGVFRTTLLWATVVFVLVEGALLWVLFRYRGKPNDPLPKQTHGNTTAEIIWTIVPALILAFIAVPTIRTIFRTYEVPKGNALVVEVIGHQWWWEFRYPQYGVVTAGELHVPTGRTVSLRMNTQDVLHSFWIPQFAAKRDVFPNRNTTLWFKTEATGNFPGACAEFCGIQHARMKFRVRSDTPAEFDAFIGTLQASAGATAIPSPVATAAAGGMQTASAGATVADDSVAMRSAVPVDPIVAQGKTLFLKKGCIGCHSLDATKTMGMGPNLAGIGSRSYIVAGTMENTDANLALWVSKPQDVKQGALMNVPPISESEAKALVAYLRTHK